MYCLHGSWPDECLIDLSFFRPIGLALLRCTGAYHDIRRRSMCLAPQRVASKTSTVNFNGIPCGAYRTWLCDIPAVRRSFLVILVIRG